MSRPPASGLANTQSNVTNKSIAIRLPWFSQPLPRLLYPLLDQIRSLAYRDRRSFFVAFSCGSRFPARLFQIFYVSFITFSFFYSFFGGKMSYPTIIMTNSHAFMASFYFVFNGVGFLQWWKRLPMRPWRLCPWWKWRKECRGAKRQVRWS